MRDAVEVQSALEKLRKDLSSSSDPLEQFKSCQEICQHPEIFDGEGSYNFVTIEGKTEQIKLNDSIID